MLEIDPNSDIPIYRQIRNGIVMMIAQDIFHPGDQLPTVRELAADIGLNPMTVAKAYRLLEEDGYIVTKGRQGCYIRQYDKLSPTIGPEHDRLKLLLAEQLSRGMSESDLLELCHRLIGGVKN